jgi:hypothetical protein
MYIREAYNLSDYEREDIKYLRILSKKLFKITDREAYNILSVKRSKNLLKYDMHINNTHNKLVTKIINYLSEEDIYFKVERDYESFKLILDMEDIKDMDLSISFITDMIHDHFIDERDYFIGEI